MNSSTLAPLLNLQSSDSTTYQSKLTSSKSKTTSTRNYTKLDHDKNHSGIIYPDHEHSSSHHHHHHQLTSSPSSSSTSHSDSSSSPIDHDIDSTDHDPKTPSRKTHPWPYSTSLTLLSAHSDHNLSDHPSHSRSRSSIKHPTSLLNQPQALNSPEQFYQYDDDQQQSSYHSYRPEWTSLPILEENSPDPHQPPYKRARTSLSPPPQSSSTKLSNPDHSQFQPVPNGHESTHHFLSYHDHHHSPSKLKDDVNLSSFESLCSPHSEADQRALNARPLKNTKRAAQNRAAQRAFRERKDRYVRDLETRSAQFDAYISRHNQLDERERSLAAREAKLQSKCHSTSKDPIPRQTIADQASHHHHHSKDEEQERIVHLQNELDLARREIHSLRSRLSTVVSNSNPAPKPTQSHSTNQAERRHSTSSLLTHPIRSDHPRFLSSHDQPTLPPINPPLIRRYP